MNDTAGNLEALEASLLADIAAASDEASIEAVRVAALGKKGSISEMLKTLGATRRRIAWVFSVEFLALGAVAGLMGSLLASGFAALVLKRLLEIDFHVDAFTHLLTIAIAALAAALAGWAASFRILGRKPLEILREE